MLVVRELYTRKMGQGVASPFNANGIRKVVIETDG
jgi:hypothetical protein